MGEGRLLRSMQDSALRLDTNLTHSITLGTRQFCLVGEAGD